MRGDPGAKGGGSGPRQRSAAGHEAWLLSRAWSLGLSQLSIQGYGRSIHGFGPLSLGARIFPVGSNQVGRVQTYGKLSTERADKFLAFDIFDEFSTSSCTLAEPT